MPGERRTLIFHTGTHKTGSTALQLFFADNLNRLNDDGVAYRFQTNADRTSGNGLFLYEKLFDRQLVDSELDALLVSYIGDSAKGLISSEEFSRFRTIEWMQIEEASVRLGFDLQFIVYLRDVAPFYASLYGQLVKGGDTYVTFSEFCDRNQYFLIIESLQALVSRFGPARIVALHYDTTMDQLEVDFMAALGIEHSNYDTSSVRKLVNRSLVPYEQAILKQLNETSGRQYAVELSIHLMIRRPNLKGELATAPEILERLKVRHKEDIEWVNTTFFAGRDVLQIQGKSSPRQRGGDDVESVQRDIDRDVNKWLMEKLGNAQAESVDYVASRIRNIDWKNAGHPDVALDFDPIAYLLLNPDILKAGIGPYEHFITSGRFETERPVKWTN